MQNLVDHLLSLLLIIYLVNHRVDVLLWSGDLSHDTLLRLLTLSHGTFLDILLLPGSGRLRQSRG